MSLLQLLIGALIVFRLTHLFQAEDGPWDIIVKIRINLGNGFWGSLFDCFNCLSMWVAIPIACYLGETAMDKILLWPALSGAAILLHRSTDRTAVIPPSVLYEEDVEESDDLLRKEETRN